MKFFFYNNHYESVMSKYSVLALSLQWDKPLLIFSVMSSTLNIFSCAVDIDVPEGSWVGGLV